MHPNLKCIDSSSDDGGSSNTHLISQNEMPIKIHDT